MSDKIEITWGKTRSRQSAKLIFGKKDPSLGITLAEINESVRYTTFVGVMVISKNNLSVKAKEIILIKKEEFEWSKVKIAVENSIKNKFPGARFIGTPER
jgi:hypothetical protein